MSLNINAETHQLVQELAALTGETQTTAVTIAVRERLERIRHLRKAGLAGPRPACRPGRPPRLNRPQHQVAIPRFSQFFYGPVQGLVFTCARASSYVPLGTPAQ